MSRRGTQGTLGETFGSEGLSRSVADISPAGSPIHASCAARIKVAYGGLRTYLSIRAVPISGSSTIRKGRLIASGGYASVFSGLDTSNNEIVAIKELLMGASDTAAAFKDVEDEFALIRRLRHENVVRYKFFDYSHSQRKCRIVLEFLSGGSTQALQKKFGPIRESMLKKLARDIFRGVCFIHEEGIIHRDIKPANILVNAKGVAKLADFGCSKKISEVSSATNHLLGTPVYMSPEFIKGVMHKKADIWAAGCTLFELATGCLPWHHTRIRDHLPLMFHITTTSESPLVLPKSFDRTFSEEFADFLERCFERSLDRRPDARQLLDHPWLTNVSAADVEGQQTLEDMCADMCTELCSFLSTEEHRDSSADLSAPAAPLAEMGAVSASRTPPDMSLSQSITKRTSISSAADSPRASRSPFHSISHSRFESNMSDALSGAFEPEDVGVQQYFVLNEGNNTFEIVTAKESRDGDLAAVPVMSLESTMAASSIGAALGNGSGPLDATLCESATTPRPAECEVTASQSEGSAHSGGHSPFTPSVTPTGFSDGPRHVNVSFSQGVGRRVRLGLTVEPSDVSVKLIDKKASFVLAMNDNIRSQIASAFAEHADTEGALDDIDDNGNDADDEECAMSARGTNNDSPMIAVSTPRPPSGASSAAGESAGSRTPSMSISLRTKSRLRIFDDTTSNAHDLVRLQRRRSIPDIDEDHFRSFSSAVVHTQGMASVSSVAHLAPMGFVSNRVFSDEGFSLHNSPSRAHGSRSVSPSFVGELHSSSRGFDSSRRIRRPIPRQSKDDDNPNEISHSPANSSDTDKARSLSD